MHQQRLRTLAALPVQVELQDEPVVPVYRCIAEEAARLHAAGTALRVIAEHFGVDDHTVAKAVRWFREES